MDSAVSVMETTVQLVASIIKVKGTAVLAAFIEVRDAEIMQLIGEQNGKLAVKPAWKALTTEALFIAAKALPLIKKNVGGFSRGKLAGNGAGVVKRAASVIKEGIEIAIIVDDKLCMALRRISSYIPDKGYEDYIAEELTEKAKG